ncbi:PAS domain-containing protein [Sulfurimonas sp.]|nr:PAS domain-containing protein [Sulfurimonas sp.]
MNNLTWNSLRVKIILNMSLIVIFFSVLLQGYRYTELESQLLKDLNTRADVIIERLSAELEVPLWELSEELIEHTLQSESKVEQVHAIYVKGTIGDININIDKDDSGDNHHQEHHIVREKNILHNEVKIGHVKLYLSHKLITQRLNEELKASILLTTIEISLVILVLWFMLNRTIIRPVETLVKSTEIIASGKYSDIKLTLNSDEIGLLGNSIQTMSDKISLRESELQESSKKLKNVTERLELAVNGTKDGLWDWDIENHKVFFSVPWKSMLGYQDSEFKNEFKSWESILHPDDIEKTKQDIIDSHNSPNTPFENIHRLRHKNGSWVWILSRGNTIFNEDGKAVRMVGFHTDITKQKELELELHEQEELLIAQSRHVAMGEMISMIAHQWRQPITVIAMGANNMLVDIGLDEVKIENFKHDAQDILKQAEYLSKTIDDFKNFFRPNKDMDTINVCDVIFEAKELMGKNISNNNIELIVSCDIEKTITTYSRELLQVIINFLKNSKEALEEQGTDNAYIKVVVENIDENIIISVSDNGGGIDQDIKSKVFDPYFSTKGLKIGTGLGLYMTKTIVEKHLLGEIDIIDIDQGVCFRVTLPQTIKSDK